MCRMPGIRAIPIMLGLLGMLTACSQMIRFDENPDYKNLVWPATPDKPRVKYIGHFSDPEQFGISKGFFAHVIEFFTGEENQKLVRPMGIVAVNRKQVYVADPGVKGVHYFNAIENDYRLIRREDDMALPSPVGLAIDDQKNVYVTDSELGAVFIIRPDAEFAVPFSLSDKLIQPTGIAYDRARKQLFVVDTAKHAIYKFDRNGKKISRMGKRGNGRKQFNYPTMLWLDNNGDLLVTDSLNFRIQRLSHTGKYLGQFGKQGAAQGKMSRPKGVATDKLGHIYIVDGLFHALQVFDSKGQLLLHLGGQGKNAGQFWLPGGIYIGDNNTIFIADSYNQRIQVFQYIGGKS